MNLKKYQIPLAILFGLFISPVLLSQNIGIGTTIPDYKLHVLSTAPSLLKLENSSVLNSNVSSQFFFKTGDWYTGGIKTIGTAANEARMSFFTFAAGASSELQERISILDNGLVGIGTIAPDHLIHASYQGSALFKLENLLVLASNVQSEQIFKTGNYYTAAIKTIGISSTNARLGLFTNTSVSPSSLLERLSILSNGNVGIGNTNPAYMLDVNGRVRIKYNLNSAGVWFSNSLNTDDVGFVGLLNDNYVGFYGDNGAGWNLVMNNTNGRVGIGTLAPLDPLHVLGSLTAVAGRFENQNASGTVSGLVGIATVATNGRGLAGDGKLIGVIGIADTAGSGDRYGMYGTGYTTLGNGYGLFCEGIGSANSYGVFAKASGGSTNWGGYFVGNVFTSGTYTPSDRKLKTGIRPIDNSLEIIKQLRPSTYSYNASDYPQMQLPEGIQFGLIADELKQVIPSAVKKTTQPEIYEEGDRINGRKTSDAVDFEAVNYVEIIPILVGAIQEQQKQIEALHVLIQELRTKGSEK